MRDMSKSYAKQGIIFMLLIMGKSGIPIMEKFPKTII